MPATDAIAVIDFETTGTSPGQGDRATEVAIVMTEGGRVVDRFQSLMNAGVHIPAFITQLTGITNAMVAAAPPAAEVLAEAAPFVGNPRARADAEMATELLGRIRHDLMLRHGVARPDHALLCALQACSKKALPRFWQRQA